MAKASLGRKLIIHLSEKLRIRGTDRAWQLEFLKSDGEWRATKYFTTMDGALHEAAQREIRTIPATGITEAIDACRRVTQKYAQIFDGAGKSPKDAR